MKKNVYLFKLVSCPYCVELANKLRNKNIKYKEIDIDEFVELFNEVVKKTGFEHVPQILVNEWDGEKFINGKYVADFDTIDDAIEQIEFLLNEK